MDNWIGHRVHINLFTTEYVWKIVCRIERIKSFTEAKISLSENICMCIVRWYDLVMENEVWSGVGISRSLGIWIEMCISYNHGNKRLNWAPKKKKKKKNDESILWRLMRRKYDYNNRK